MQSIQKQTVVARVSADGGKLPLPEQPRAPTGDATEKRSLENVSELRKFIEDNFDELFKKAKVFCYGKSDEAKELVQELYPRMALVLEHSRCSAIEYPKACAYQVLARLAIDRHRKLTRTRARVKRLEFPDSIPEPEPTISTSRGELDELCKALDSLPSREKQIIIGIFIEGCRAKDLAERLGISQSRLSELKAFALDQLREVLA